MKKILILTAGFGEGEDVAATNVRDAIEHLAPQDARVEVLDLLDSCYGRFQDILRNTFQAVISHPTKPWYGLRQLLGTSQVVEGQVEGLTRLRDSVRDALRTFKPDVLVSTCPIYNFLIGEIYSDGRTRDFTLVALVTDAVMKESPWPKAPADSFTVTNEAVGRALIADGVLEKKIEVFGFPVQWKARTASGKFENTLSDLAANARPRLLYVINSARKKSAEDP